MFVISPSEEKVPEMKQFNQNLKINSNNLTTHYDLFMTYMNLLGHQEKPEFVKLG